MIRIVSYVDDVASYWAGRRKGWTGTQVEAKTFATIGEANTARRHAKRYSPDRKIVMHTGDSAAQSGP